jgi:hypothetical protein
MEAKVMKTLKQLREDVRKAATAVSHPRDFSYTSSHDDYVIVPAKKLRRLQKTLAALAAREKK